MSTQLVKAFNYIPQEKGPSGIWHFDLRYNPLEPNPHHILVCVQVHGNAIHVEPLPIGFPSGRNGIEYFPEEAVEAAPEIAMAIVHVFVNKLNTPGSEDSQGPAILIPSKLTMRDRDLPLYVGRELRNLGVLPTSLHNIAISSPTVNERATARLHPVFNKMKKEAGYKCANAAMIPAPESIGLWNFKLDPPRIDNSPGLYKEHLEYVQLKLNTSPQLLHMDRANYRTELGNTMEMLEEVPEDVVREDADDGDPHAAYDYGMRLYVGLDCKRNRTLARYYVVKAITSPDASDELKAAAHSFLLNWCVYSSKDDFRKRYLYAATHHANMATVLCRASYAAQPPGTPEMMPSTPTVLSFMRDVFMRMVSDAPDLALFCKDGMKAADERLKQVAAGQQKLQSKKLKAPLKYRCAAVGCGVEADKGKMLAQCAGKCDMDKKPSYCSKECQKSDWKNHKPFCRPGAECSVIDDSTLVQGSTNNVKSTGGALQVPIMLQDGSTTYVSSSTLDAQSLKEIRDAAKDRLSDFDPSRFPHGHSIERF